jgi:hypothetical protein
MSFDTKAAASSKMFPYITEESKWMTSEFNKKFYSLETANSYFLL